MPEPGAAGPARLRSPHGARLRPRPFSRLRPVAAAVMAPARRSRPPADPGAAREVSRCGGGGGGGLTALLCVPRLWHQLTLQVLDFVQDPCFAQGDGLIKVSGVRPAFLVFCTRKSPARGFSLS